MEQTHLQTLIDVTACDMLVEKLSADINSLIHAGQWTLTDQQRGALRAMRTELNEMGTELSNTRTLARVKIERMPHLANEPFTTEPTL